MVSWNFGLINEHTHSAAEMVASFASQNRLATLVVTRTAGEVLGGANFKLGGGYILRMPIADPYTWQGNSIEGKGIEPDVVENSTESLSAGVDTQLEKALQIYQELRKRMRAMPTPTERAIATQP